MAISYLRIPSQADNSTVFFSIFGLSPQQNSACLQQPHTIASIVWYCLCMLLCCCCMLLLLSLCCSLLFHVVSRCVMLCQFVSYSFISLHVCGWWSFDIICSHFKFLLSAALFLSTQTISNLTPKQHTRHSKLNTCMYLNIQTHNHVYLIIHNYTILYIQELAWNVKRTFATVLSVGKSACVCLPYLAILQLWSRLLLLFYRWGSLLVFACHL